MLQSAKQLAVRSLAMSVLILIALPLSANDAPLAPDSEVMDRLLAGEVVMESRESGKDGAMASAYVLISSPVTDIWEVIISCEAAYLFLNGLEDCEVLEDRGDYALTRQVVDKGWLMPQLEFTFETRRQPFTLMESSLVSGNLKVLTGRWDFLPIAGGTLVYHALTLKTSLPVPRWLIRRNLRRDFPDMMRCIRQISESRTTGDPSVQAASTCPGNPVDSQPD